jgi:hypothetical protein
VRAYVAHDRKDYTERRRAEADREFRRLEREHRELSGRVPTHGRKRTTSPTGFQGRGVRGMRYKEDGRTPPVRPGGRPIGARAPVVGKPSFEDAPETLARALGTERIERLRTSFAKRGATNAERADRTYLAVVLDRLGNVTPASRAAAELCGTNLRTVRALRARHRKRPVSPEENARIVAELRARLGS